MMKLIAATNNQKKLKEIKAIMSDTEIELLTLKGAGLDIEIEETGSTFEENALIKARTVAKLSGLCALSDDSGLMVDALNGEPGVYSARYAGEGASDEDLIKKLLDNMKSVPDDKRSARFVSVIAFCTPKGEHFTVRGECHGEIIRKPIGAGGFGYDPVFYIKEYGKTFAELEPEIKNQISHRGNALKVLKTRMNEILRMINNGL